MGGALGHLSRVKVWKGAGRDGGTFRKMVSIWLKGGNIAQRVILLNVFFHSCSLLWRFWVPENNSENQDTRWKSTTWWWKSTLRHFVKIFYWYWIGHSLRKKYSHCDIPSAESNWDLMLSRVWSMKSRKYAIFLWQTFLCEENKSALWTK